MRTLSQNCELTLQKLRTKKIMNKRAFPNIWCIVFFPVLRPLTCGRQSRCPGWTYKLPGGQKFSIKLPRLSVGFPQRRPLNLIERPQVYKLPRGAIYKPPCVHLINNPFFAIHQVFALSNKAFWPSQVMDVRAVGSRTSSQKKHFPALRAMGRKFLARAVHRTSISRPKTFSLGCCSVPELLLNLLSVPKLLPDPFWKGGPPIVLYRSWVFSN